MEITGIDVGYSFTKTHTGLMFPSRMTKTEPMLGYGNVLRWKGETYFIGTGSGTVSLNKVDEEITAVLSLYALCGTLQQEKCRVVTGLPIGQYASQKDALKALFVEKLKDTTVLYNGAVRRIIIEDAAVYPQGLLSIDGEYVSVDVGGMTVDIAYVVDGEIAYSKTLYCGMRSLHSKIIDMVNNKYECKLPSEYAHRILTEGLYVHGKQDDISFLLPAYQEHVETIVSEVRESTPKITTVYVTGGGAEILYESIKKRIPYAKLVENSQFSNADNFKMWGDMLWA